MVVKARPKTLKEGGGLLGADGGEVTRGSALEVLDEGWCCSRSHKPLPMMDAGVGAGRKHNRRRTSRQGGGREDKGVGFPN